MESDKIKIRKNFRQMALSPSLLLLRVSLLFFPLTYGLVKEHLRLGWQVHISLMFSSLYAILPLITLFYLIHSILYYHLSYPILSYRILPHPILIGVFEKQQIYTPRREIIAALQRIFSPDSLRAEAPLTWQNSNKYFRLQLR